MAIDVKQYSKDMDLDTEAQALVDHFHGNPPNGGGEMSQLFGFFEPRLWIHPNDWKMIYERSLKIARHGKSKPVAPVNDGAEQL